MSVYLITYSLNSHHHSHEEDNNLNKKIKSLGEWAHFMPSSWFIYSTLSATEIKNALKDVLNEKDLLFVTKVTDNYDGFIHPGALSWLDQRIKTTN